MFGEDAGRCNRSRSASKKPLFGSCEDCGLLLFDASCDTGCLDDCADPSRDIGRELLREFGPDENLDPVASPCDPDGGRVVGVLRPPAVPHVGGQLSHKCKSPHSPSLSSAMSSQLSSKVVGFSRPTRRELDATPSEATCADCGLSLLAAATFASEETAAVPDPSSGAGADLAIARLPNFRKEAACGAIEGTIYSALFGQFQAKACKSRKYGSPSKGGTFRRRCGDSSKGTDSLLTCRISFHLGTGPCGGGGLLSKTGAGACTNPG